VRKDPAVPIWNVMDHESVDVNIADEFIEDIENRNNWQNSMKQYFGMVECIDSNVGKLLDHLDEKGIAENTIVVFTSDHGDLLGEHGKSVRISFDG
jgi:arylsulfatase A-like enzyme